MFEKYYSIHNIIKFKISTDKKFKWNLKNIYGSFQNFEIDKADKVDFEVYLGKFKPSNNNCCILENKYYIKEGYFYCKKDMYKFTKWEFEMDNLDEENTIVNISSNFFGYLWMAGFIIEFLIHYKMNQKGYPLIHASALSQNNKGYIFSARGGGGKTTISMNLLNDGFKILGDNFVIINKGRILSYFSPLNIFTYNLAPIIKSNLTLKNKINLNIKKVIYKLTFGFIKIFTKINPKEILTDSIEDNSSIHKIFVLLPKEVLKLRKLTKEELCDFLLLNQMLDTLLFLPYITEYAYIYPNSKLANHWKLYKSNLIKNIPDNIEFTEIEVPLRYNKSNFNDICNYLDTGEINEGNL